MEDYLKGDASNKRRASFINLKNLYTGLFPY